VQLNLIVTFKQPLLLGLKYGESEGSRINDHHLFLKDKQQAIEDLE